MVTGVDVFLFVLIVVLGAALAIVWIIFPIVMWVKINRIIRLLGGQGNEFTENKVKEDESKE